MQQSQTPKSIYQFNHFGVEPGDMPNKGAKNKAKKVQPTEKTRWNCQIGQTAEGFMTILPRTHANPKKNMKKHLTNTYKPQELLKKPDRTHFTVDS